MVYLICAIIGQGGKGEIVHGLRRKSDKTPSLNMLRSDHVLRLFYFLNTSLRAFS